MALVLRISIFLESENWSSDGIWETSVKPLISINPSARVLHLNKTKQKKTVNLVQYAHLPQNYTCKRTCKASSSWPALFDGVPATRDDHPQKPSKLRYEKNISIYKI